MEVGPQICIRESRRIIGEYVVSEGDILGRVSIPDTIGVNGWTVEAHVSGAVRRQFPKIPESRCFNHLPYRMIVPQRIDNLFVAGCCARLTDDGQSSARVSGPCFAMGHSAGYAAVIALASGVAPRSIDVAALQRRLTENGAYLGLDIEAVEWSQAKAAAPV